MFKKNIINSFVILHYNEKTLVDTYECVDSIKNNIDKNDNYNITIVENGSNDSSAEKLTSKYKFDELVDIIISKENLGFARGNNLGCEHAIKEYDPDFLIVINNDTVIEQKEFLTKIKERYDKEAFHILGPCIWNKNNNNQNPVTNLLTNMEQINNALVLSEKKLKELNRISNSKLLRGKAMFNTKVYSILSNFRTKDKCKENNVANKNEIKNVALHGSAIIFSKDYYKKYEHVFFPGTFLYLEEDILFYRVLQDKLISVYYPDIHIFHKEDSSTKASINKNINQYVFKEKNIIDSLNTYCKLILNEITWR